MRFRFAQVADTKTAPFGAVLLAVNEVAWFFAIGFAVVTGYLAG